MPTRVRFICGYFAAADLIIGRAGAGTVAELAALGKPSILIPLPLSGGGEQDVNASLLDAIGAAASGIKYLALALLHYSSERLGPGLLETQEIAASVADII